MVLDASGLKPGDTAGLALFNRPYAWLGVSVDAEGPALTYVTEEAGRVERVPLTAGRVWLRAACDFLREEARFSYSTDGRVFQPIGDPFRLGHTVTIGFVKVRESAATARPRTSKGTNP